MKEEKEDKKACEKPILVKQGKLTAIVEFTF